LSGADGTDEAEASRAADHLVFHAQALFAIGIDEQPGGAITLCGRYVPIPEIKRL
jgi:hypothetical protein